MYPIMHCSSTNTAERGAVYVHPLCAAFHQLQASSNDPHANTHSHRILVTWSEVTVRSHLRLYAMDGAKYNQRDLAKKTENAELLSEVNVHKCNGKDWIHTLLIHMFYD